MSSLDTYLDKHSGDPGWGKNRKDLERMVGRNDWIDPNPELPDPYKHKSTPSEPNYEYLTD